MTIEQYDNIKQMLDSPDREFLLLALTYLLQTLGESDIPSDLQQIHSTLTGHIFDSDPHIQELVLQALQIINPITIGNTGLAVNNPYRTMIIV